MPRPTDAVEPQEAYEALAKAMPERELQELVRKAALDRRWLHVLACDTMLSWQIQRGLIQFVIPSIAFGKR